MLATNGDYTFSRRIAGAIISPVPIANRLLQILRSTRRCVLREISMDRRYSCILDVVWRWKVRFTSPEVHQIHAFAAQPISLCSHLHRRGDTNQVDSV